MELVIPWISYWVCHHFGMSINRFWSCDLVWSSNDIKYQMMLCDESFPLDPFWRTLKSHVISSLSFSNFYFENLSVEMTRSSGPNYREGSCPIFFGLGPRKNRFFVYFFELSHSESKKTKKIFLSIMRSGHLRLRNFLILFKKIRFLFFRFFFRNIVSFNSNWCIYSWKRFK